MFAHTVTASVRKDPINPEVGVAAVIGYVSSRLASSSVLIAEISASTVSTCCARANRARTAVIKLDGTYFIRPRPAVFGTK